MEILEAYGQIKNSLIFSNMLLLNSELYYTNLFYYDKSDQIMNNLLISNISI